MQNNHNPVMSEISRQLGQQIIVIAEQRHMISELLETSQAALTAMAQAVRDGSVSETVADVWRKTVPGFADMGVIAVATGSGEPDQKPGVVHSIKGTKKS